MAGEDWHRGGRDRGVAARRALAAAMRGDCARREGRRTRLRPEHLRLRPPRRARCVLRTSGALRGPPDGGRGGAGGRRGRAVPPRAGGARGRRPFPSGPDTGGAGGRHSPGRRPRSRAGRGPRAAAPVRDGQPAAHPARAVGQIRARDRHGGGQGALALHAGGRRGARSRGVAFGSAPRSWRRRSSGPHDIALRLERNRWNGWSSPA